MKAIYSPDTTHINNFKCVLRKFTKPNLNVEYNTYFFQLVEGEEIRLFNAGGEVSGHIQNQDIYFHFVGVLLDSTSHG